MEFQEVAKGRRSIRRYANRPVEQEKIDALLELARWAPSGSNTQPSRFLVITDKDKRMAIEACLNNQQPYVHTAPVHIVVLGDLGARVEDLPAAADILEDKFRLQRERNIRDTAISLQQLWLAATDLGLGACWIGDFTQAAMRPVLATPPDHWIGGIMLVGYADEKPEPTYRHRLSDIVSYEQFTAPTDRGNRYE